MLDTEYQENEFSVKGNKKNGINQENTGVKRDKKTGEVFPRFWLLFLLIEKN
ncbi:hypothetical protein [Wandonia haliotis]|uniref:hypothetical protein n=1 Tax=Wandonia haliotis TaxID=574963 RepID=UPI0031E1F83F